MVAHATQAGFFCLAFSLSGDNFDLASKNSARLAVRLSCGSLLVIRLRTVPLLSVTKLKNPKVNF